MYQHVSRLSLYSRPLQSCWDCTFRKSFSIVRLLSGKTAVRDASIQSLSYLSIKNIPTSVDIGKKFDLRFAPNAVEGLLAEENVLDMLRELIGTELQDILKIDPKVLSYYLIRPNKLQDGDLILPIPKLKSLKPVVNEELESCVQRLQKCKFIEKVTYKRNFLQFFISQDVLIEATLAKILQRKTNYGFFQRVKNKTVIIEFSSPNIAKPFHAGHLRSTIIGGYLSNIYEKFGWKVIRMNYLGDWGQQFAILALGFQKYGDAELLQQNPITHLFEVYVKINRDIEKEKQENKNDIQQKARKYFFDLENGDEKALKLWGIFRDLSIKEYMKTYSKLNINFDVYSGESQISKSKIDEVISKLNETNSITSKDGASTMDLSSIDPKLGSIIISKSNNTSLYVTRDICTAIERKRIYHFDKMIYVIASQQDLYMKQLFSILEKLDIPWVKQLEHVNFGMVLGMSTRKGNVVFLNTIIDEATKQVQSRIHEKFPLLTPSRKQELAENIGLSALVIQDMQSKRINNYKFEWDRILSFEGDTGPYLQYQHARLCNLLKKLETDIDFDKTNLMLLKDPNAIVLIRILVQFPDVINQSYETKEPSKIVTYLFKLAHQFVVCYKTLWIQNQPPNIAAAHYVLYRCTQQVLANGLEILGLNPVDQM